MPQYLYYLIPAAISILLASVHIIFNYLLDNKLKDYIKKNDAISPEQLLKHQIACNECLNKDIDTKFDKVSQRLDDIINILLKR